MVIGSVERVCLVFDFFYKIGVCFILKGTGSYQPQDIQKPGQAHGSSNRRQVSPVQEAIQRLGRSQW